MVMILEITTPYYKICASMTRDYKSLLQTTEAKSMIMNGTSSLSCGKHSPNLLPDVWATLSWMHTIIVAIFLLAVCMSFPPPPPPPSPPSTYTDWFPTNNLMYRDLLSWPFLLRVGYLSLFIATRDTLCAPRINIPAAAHPPGRKLGEWCLPRCLWNCFPLNYLMHHNLINSALSCQGWYTCHNITGRLHTIWEIMPLHAHLQ